VGRSIEIVFMIALIVSLCETAGATEFYVSETGWFREGGSFNASETPIQSAIDNASDYDRIHVYNGSYTENVDVGIVVTLAGEGADLVTVTAADILDHVFSVTADRVNISGFTVTGINSTTVTERRASGIHLYYADHCNISNNNASCNRGFSVSGIHANHSDGCIIANNRVHDDYFGIHVSYSRDNALLENDASGCHDGFCIQVSNLCTLADNIADHNLCDLYYGTGIRLLSSSRINLTNNTCNNNKQGGICLSGSSKNNVRDNKCNSGYMYGIQLLRSSHNNFTGNTCNSNRNGMDIVASSSYNAIIRNDISHNTDGVWLASPHNTFSGNVLDSNTHRSICLDGAARDECNNSIDTTNTMNGGVVHYYSDVRDLEIDGIESTHLTVASGENITIWNNNITNGDGIYLIYLNDSVVLNNTASENYEGLYLQFCFDNLIEKNTCNSNDYRGICLYTRAVHSQANNNTILGNTVCQNDYGISTHASSENDISSNNASLNLNNGISIYSGNNNTVIGNTAYLNRYHGIYLRDSENNSITDNSASFSELYFGIYIYMSDNNELIRNTANHNAWDGIRLYYSDNSVVTGNCASENNNYGIDVFGADNATVLENTVAYNNYSGIIVYDITTTGGDVEICNNTITNNGNYGILMDSAACFTRAAMNTIGGSRCGIRLRNASRVTIVANTVSGNSVGINLTESSNNLIHNNHFENVVNAYDCGVNTWNTTPIARTGGTNIAGGSWFGGNYWNDYAGEDLNGDGLGDTMLPHNSSGGIRNGGDRHPLMGIVCGDVNYVEPINIMDVMLLLNNVHDPDGHPLKSEWAGNVDGDSDTNIMDVVLLLNHVYDPTDYPLNCI